MKVRETELLTPTGSLDVLKTAVVFGTDAVHIGGRAFGLRVKAHNFSRNDMKEGIAFVHAREVEVYVTANILARNGDLPGVEVYFEELKEIGPDTPIISNPSVFAIAKKVLPGMEIHISTQASSANYGTYLFWRKLGVGRVVITRELSPDKIWEIREYILEGAEIESSIHEAMCVSYSGRCLLSNFFAGRDANQGACAHPCRWRYPVVKKTRPGEYVPVHENECGTYIFNSKNLRMIGHIPEMMDTGIDNFKVEGRMKTALYAVTAARTYRKAVDDYKKDPQLYRDHMEWYRQGIRKYTYRGFTTGFYSGRPIKNTQIYDNNTYAKSCAYLGTVPEMDGRGQYPIQQKNKFCVDDTMEMMEPDGRNLELAVAGMEDEEGNAQDGTPHPKQVLWTDLGMNVDLEVYNILRRKEESA